MWFGEYGADEPDDEAALVQPDLTGEAVASPCPEDRNLMTKDKELCVALHIFRR